ncbi:hypothetical protein HK405_002736, partial [Cladochytrium tenue]
MVWSKPHMHGRIPAPRRGHTACAWGERIYVYGGYNDQTGQFFDDLLCFDTVTMYWDVMEVPGSPTRPPPSRHHVAVVHWGNMFIHGGESPSPIDGTVRPVADFHYVHLQMGSTGWCEMPTEGVPPSARSHHVGVVVGNVFLFIGGVGLLGDVIQEVIALDLQDNTLVPVWTLPVVPDSAGAGGVRPVPVPGRAGGVGISLGMSVLFVGGARGGGDGADAGGG